MRCGIMDARDMGDSKNNVSNAFLRCVQDFLQSLSQASRGTVQEKMRWIFCLYDLNGDGYISKAEMTSV